MTHTGVKGVCPSPRNLSDSEIRYIAERGGLIGIGYGPLFNCELSIVHTTDSIQYVAGLVGVEHVALGSDYDGDIELPFDASGLPLMTQALKDEGFTDDEIRKIMGDNVVSFLSRNWRGPPSLAANRNERTSLCSGPPPFPAPRPSGTTSYARACSVHAQESWRRHYCQGIKLDQFPGSTWAQSP